MIIVIDNYDSFTYNLVQYLLELGAKLKVFRNDAVSVKKVLDAKPESIVISPGPGRPDEAGIAKDLIKKASILNIPILGVCLGHQAIAEVFGGKVIQSPLIMHGKVSKIYHKKRGIFKGISSPFKATRYHSLIVEKKTLPDVLQIEAWTEDETNDKEIMAIKHKKDNIWGVQFHPESILTSSGKKLLANFLKIKR
jgi:anthranilate synthase/aminodeoxychorismate synthase-like glutamine amidotransferase